MHLLKLLSAIAAAGLYLTATPVPEATFQALADGSLLTKLAAFQAGVLIFTVVGYSVTSIAIGALSLPRLPNFRKGMML